jgi:hypothetical protein
MAALQHGNQIRYAARRILHQQLQALRQVPTLAEPHTRCTREDTAMEQDAPKVAMPEMGMPNVKVEWTASERPYVEVRNHDGILILAGWVYPEPDLAPDVENCWDIEAAEDWRAPNGRHRAETSGS